MRRDCRFCHATKFELILDLGKQPLAGEFLEAKQVGKEKFYPLRVYQCLDCGLVQLRDVINRKNLFKSFLSSVAMTGHFFEYAVEMKEKFLQIGDLVIEIGSNDGVLLSPLKNMGIKVLGFEPQLKIAELAQKQQLPTIINYFSLKLAKFIVEDYGQANAIFANNVLAHIDDMDDVIKGINYLLKDNGVLVFEVHYLVDLVEKLQYDTIYHEHLCYYSLNVLMDFLGRHGLQVFDAKRISTHAGSIRVYVQKFGSNKYRVQTKKLWKLLEQEDKLDFQGFANTVVRQKIDLWDLLKKLKGKKIIGYGAAGRANTLLNYCGVTSRDIQYIVDESPLRYGHFTPGTHIPVVQPSEQDLEADYILILAWNYQKEIIKKLKGFKGKIIVPLPKVEII